MKISKLQAVVNFETDLEILLTIGHNIKNLQKKHSAKIHNLSIPGSAPPEAPRLLISSQNFIINVCLNRFDFIIQIPTHISSDIVNVSKFSASVIKELCEFLVSDDLNYKWTGIVIDYNFPLNSQKVRAIKAITPVFDKLLNLDRKDKELASFHLQFGFEEGELYKNYTITGYDAVNFTLPANAKKGEPFQLTVSDSDVVECGVSIAVDINNKAASSQSSLIDDIMNINREHVLTLEKLPSTLNLEGILQ